FSGVDFTVHAGEVLGIAGLVGAGLTEVLRAGYGADPYDSGTVILQGRALPGHDVGRSIARGLGLVPEDRKTQGLVLAAGVAENAGYATLRSTARNGRADRRAPRGWQDWTCRSATSPAATSRRSSSPAG